MMKATTAASLSQTIPAEKPWLAVYADLFKARLTCLVLLTTLVGFYVGFRGPVDVVLMFHLLAGTALLASGAAALNQLVEREYDAKMRRTQDRPLPSGRLQPQTVLMVGCATALLGLIYLAQAVNLTTSLVGALSLVCYLFVYTPLKRVTWLNTLAGAVPGALPPLMGWTAARGELSSEGLALFAIQAFWQLPHFMAIAWMYREEYARAGFQMLPVVDPDGRRSGRQAVYFAFALMLVSVLPYVFNLVGRVYLSGALVLGLGFLGFACRFAGATWAVGRVNSRTAETDWQTQETLERVESRGAAGSTPLKRGVNETRWNASLPVANGRARQLFYASLVYLPLLLALMVLDKVK
jgi:protoheme IX farnesyltransferase